VASYSLRIKKTAIKELEAIPRKADRRRIVKRIESLADDPRYWAECFGTAPFLPMSRAEMDALGWDSCDIIIVTGDAYVDHPSFGMAVIGRLLEAQGFRVGIIAQPDWQSKEAFEALGRPNLFFGVAAGNMDSMINRYTADRKVRSDDAYTPGGGRQTSGPLLPGLCPALPRGLSRGAHRAGWHRGLAAPHRPLRLLAGQGAPFHPAGRRRRSAALRQRRTRVVELAHRLARGEADRHHHRHPRHGLRAPRHADGWLEIDSTRIDRPGRIDRVVNPYVNPRELSECQRQEREAALYGVPARRAGRRCCASIPIHSATATVP
jgi:hypothetical protein